MTKIILRTLLQCIFVFQIGANSSFSEAPRSVEYIREGDDISLKWTYTIGSGDTLDYVLWKSYDPAAGSSTTDDADQFRLVVKTTSQVVVLPDKAKGELKGVNLYEGRVSMKDQATLEIRNVTLDNTYICELSYVDGGGSHSIKTQVRVIPTVPPQIINSSFSSPLDVVEGNDVIVNCSATGKPAPNVTWTNSPGNEKLNQSVSSALLVIKNTRRDGNKDYTCTANGVGNTVSKNLQLNVLYKPSITQPTESPHSQTVWVTVENKLECTADGRPEPTIAWTKNGASFTDKVEQDGNTGTLTLASVSQATEDDQYICTATNSEGEASVTFKLALGPPGTEPTTPAPTDPNAGARGDDDGGTGVLVGAIVGAVVGVLIIVILIVYFVKCRKGNRGNRAPRPVGLKERGTKSVSDIDDYEPVTAQNELPQYASVDRSKKFHRKPDLNYAELDHRGAERSVDQRPGNRRSEPTTYADIVQTWEPTNESTYANVPRGGQYSNDML